MWFGGTHAVTDTTASHTHMIGHDGGATAVVGAIRNFRNRVKRILLARANVAIDPGVDLIVNDREYGYRFSEKIVVVERSDLLMTDREEAGEEPVAERLEEQRASDGTPVVQAEDARTRWILAELAKAGRIRRWQVTLRTGCSDATARRALVRLREEGRIVFEGSARSGFWRLA